MCASLSVCVYFSVLHIQQYIEPRIGHHSVQISYRMYFDCKVCLQVLEDDIGVSSRDAACCLIGPCFISSDCAFGDF